MILEYEKKSLDIILPHGILWGGVKSEAVFSIKICQISEAQRSKCSSCRGRLQVRTEGRGAFSSVSKQIQSSGK